MCVFLTVFILTFKMVAYESLSIILELPVITFLKTSLVTTISMYTVQVYRKYTRKLNIVCTRPGSNAVLHMSRIKC